MNSQKEDNLEILFEVLSHEQIKFKKELVCDKDFVLGCRSTSIVKPNDFDFLHDLSHLVQFTDEELISHYIENNGKLSFHVPSVYVYNRWWSEPVTDKISMRELETFYIQYILENTILVKNKSFEEWADDNEIIELMGYLPDQFNFKYKPDMTYILKRVSEFKDKWSYDIIINRWKNIKICDKYLKSVNFDEVLNDD